MMGMHVLPHDVMREIVSHLSPADSRVVAFVSTGWRDAVRDVGGEPAFRLPLPVDRFLGSEADVRWAVDRGCPLTAKTFARAAKRGNVGVLCALREMRCPYDSTACTLAAGYGRLDALLWLRTKKCPWNFLACANASQSGERGAARVVRWLSLRKTKCPCGRTYH